jgi:hypothetical protein
MLASLLCHLSLRRPCRQTLLPPLDTTATVTIERRLYRPPLPQLPAITIATVKCQCPPSSSIAAVKR